MLDYTDYDTRLAGYALVTDQDSRVLLSRWIGPDGPLWTCPGGGIEFGESVVEGIARELFEETGFEVQVGRLLDVRTWEVRAEDRLHPSKRPMRAVQVFHEATVTGGELTFEQYAWVIWVHVGMTLVLAAVVAYDIARGRPGGDDPAADVLGEGAPQSSGGSPWAARDAAISSLP